MTDERIKAAATELSAALTEGGKDYWVSARQIDVTQIQDTGRRVAYVVEVEETARRYIAP